MLVSVIIPTFNRADSVVEAIQSVRAQTYPDKQIIVVDDGSDDNTRSRIGKISGVEYHYQDKKGQGAARNAGFEHARGDYIASLDSDDVWRNDFLSKSVECLEKQDLDFVFSGWQTQMSGKIFPNIWENSGKLEKYSQSSDGSWLLFDYDGLRRLFVKSCPAPSSSLLIRRTSMAAGWNTDLKIADDWCLILDMVMAKQCRAAFTFEYLWTKNINYQNVYDGRNRRETALELDIHDVRIIKERFSSQLTFSEKTIFERRIVKGHFISALHSIKELLRFN